MQCRNCGTEIADKAIVCFRCGTSPTDPVRRPAKITPRRSPLVSVVLVVVLAILALYLGLASRTAANQEIYQLAAGLCAGAALALVFIRILRR